jgi:hypothetical protein
MLCGGYGVTLWRMPLDVILEGPDGRALGTWRCGDCT